MTKTSSKRTHPLDRDGDGFPGGSLPGNQTAPMAHDAQATTPAGPSWTRDNAAILLKLAEAGIEIDTTKPASLSEETLVGWEDHQARWAEEFADQMNAEGSFMCDGGEWLTADKQLIEVPQILERYLSRPVEVTDPLAGADDDTRAAIEGQLRPISDDHVHVPAEGDVHVPAEGEDETVDTFDAEQVASSQVGAGEGAVVQEEGETVADPATAAVPLADALVTVQTDTAPVAVRIRELRILTESRRLYKSEQGYSASYGAPFIDQSTVDAWVKAGLAEYVPSAGREGGVRCTHEARAALSRARLEGAG